MTHNASCNNLNMQNRLDKPHFKFQFVPSASSKMNPVNDEWKQIVIEEQRFKSKSDPVPPADTHTPLLLLV